MRRLVLVWAAMLVRMASVGALTFLAIMFTLFSADYATRGWLSD